MTQESQIRDWQPEGRGLLTAALAAYVGAVALVTAGGGYAFLPKVAAVPFMILAALVVRRGWFLVRDWAVFLSLILLFDAIRGLIYAAIGRWDLKVYMGYVIDMEYWLVGGRLFPVALQEWLRGSPIQPAVDGVLTFVHSTHFVAFVLVGLAIWVFRPHGFRRFTASVVWTVYGGALIYFLVPTVPPWMAAGIFHVIPPVDHISAEIYAESVPALQLAFDVNPIAAMPSLHTAMPTVSAVVAFLYFGRRSWWIFLYPLMVYASILYLGEHYLVDVLAGLVLAGVVLAVVCRPSAVRADFKDVEIHPRELPWRVALDPERISKSVRRSLLVTALAAIAGFATIWIGRPWVPGPDFVARELQSVPDVAARVTADYAEARSEAPETVARARILYAEGRLDEATAAVDALSVDLPSDPEPLFWRALFAYDSQGANGPATEAAVDEIREFSDQRRVDLYLSLLAALP